MSKLPVSPAIPGYTDATVRLAMVGTAEEYACRLRKNADKRGIAAGSSLSRHLNPEPLEAARSLSRSADSVLGNMLEVLARTLARNKWGLEACPPLVRGAGASEADMASVAPRSDRQVVVTRVDKAALEKLVRSCYSPPHVDLRRLKQIAQNPPRGSELIVQPLDMIVLLGDSIVAAELKASGDLDVKNGPKNIETLLKIAIMLGPQALPRLVLANNEAATSQATRFASDEILVGRNEFWSWLLPTGRDWTWFDAAFAAAAAPVRQELADWIAA